MAFRRAATVGCAAFLALACDTRFLEKTPPVLARERLTFVAGQRAEPFVFGAILDLQIPDPALCAATRDRVLEVLRTAAAGSGAVVAELETRDLSPGCAQAPGRTVPADVMDAEVRALESAFPDGAIRPIFLYVNNIELALATSVSASLEELRSRGEARGALRPLLWGMALPSARLSFGFDAGVAWTHATDDSMWNALGQLVSAAAPLQTREDLEQSAPLTSPERARELKICTADSAVAISGCARTGAACLVAPGSPAARVTFPPLVAAPRSQFARLSASVSFESCAGRCDRFIDREGDLTRWDHLVGCVTGGG